MITLGSKVRARHGSASIIGTVVRIWGGWIEVEWPNGEVSRHHAGDLVEVYTERIR